MGIDIVVAAVLTAASAASGIAAFFSITTTTAFLLTATAVGLGLNYLRNKIPGAPAVSPIDRDYRVSRPAATEPARFLYGRARVGGFPIYLDEFEWADDRFVGSREYQLQAYLITEGQIPGRTSSPQGGPVEAVWINGRRMPYNPTYQIRTSGRREDGSSQVYYRGSNTHLDAPIALAQTRINAIQAAYPSNPPRGVDILLNHLRSHKEDLEDRRGRRTQYTPNATFVGPEDGIKWEARWQNTRGVESNVLVFEHYGGTADDAGSHLLSRIDTWKTRESRGELTGSVNWDTDTMRLKGISALMVELRDPSPRDETDFLNASPRVEFLVKGRQITWPGQDTPEWTENAAAIYYDWLVSVQGVDPDTIDEPSFTAAYALCNERVIIPELARGDETDDTKPIHANDVLAAMFGSDTATWPSDAIQDIVLAIWNETYAGDDNAEIRYSINGVVDTTMDPREVERQFNAAWGGYVVERGGRIYFEPGRGKTITRTLAQEDLVGDRAPQWQIEPALQDRATSVTCTLTQSHLHDWLSHTMPKVAEAGVADDAPQDLGQWAYVAYPTTASRLLRQALFRANGGKAVSLTVGRGTDWANYRIAPTDRVGLNMPLEGQADADIKWFVDRVETTMAGTVGLSLSQEREGTYDDVVSVPLEIGAAGRTGAGQGFTRSPPVGVTWERTGVLVQEHGSGDNAYATYRWYYEPRVGGVAPERSVQAEYTYRAAAGVAVPREDGDPPTWGTTIDGHTYYARQAGNPFDFYLRTRVPLLDSPDSHGFFGSHEVELRLRYNDGRTPSRWSDVAVVDLSPPVSIPEGLIASGS